MKSEIIREETRTVEHRKNQKAKLGDKSNIRVPIFRGLDTKTYNYILRNRYYPDRLLIRNELEIIFERRKARFPERYLDVATA
jgi:hypothetical protein